MYCGKPADPPGRPTNSIVLGYVLNNIEASNRFHQRQLGHQLFPLTPPRTCHGLVRASAPFRSLPASRLLTNSGGVCSAHRSRNDRRPGTFVSWENGASCVLMSCGGPPAPGSGRIPPKYDRRPVVPEGVFEVLSAKCKLIHRSARQTRAKSPYRQRYGRQAMSLPWCRPVWNSHAHN